MAEKAFARLRKCVIDRDSVHTFSRKIWGQHGRRKRGYAGDIDMYIP